MGKTALYDIIIHLQAITTVYGTGWIINYPKTIFHPMTDKNEFHMPFLMDVGKAVKIIIDGIKKEKHIIQFPLPTVIGSKIVKFIPDWLFDYLMSKPLPPRKNN